MNKYLSDWLRIIEEMKNDNTYKTAWGRGIIECVFLEEYEVIEDNVIIKQSDIAQKMIQYYWNQTFFFGLTQGRNPIIVQRVNELIEKYKQEVNTYPVPWDKVEQYFKQDREYFNKIISAILANARTNVCPRFKNVSNKEVLDIYTIDNTNTTITFSLNNVLVLKEYAFVLSKLLNFKWAQLLERYNNSPKISNKVTAAAERKIKRQNLTKYKKLLLDYYHNKEEIVDFYTGEVIDRDDIHIDHVIPWSFIYSDDIWNLVVTKSTTNLEKSNRPPTKEDVDRLKERNKDLLSKLKQTNTNYRKQLEYSIENNTLKKLYINLKGE